MGRKPQSGGIKTSSARQPTRQEEKVSRRFCVGNKLMSLIVLNQEVRKAKYGEQGQVSRLY